MSKWAVQIAQSNPAILKVGCFGSYARGDWGVGSDVDILILVKESDLPFESRALQWDANHLPVPAGVIDYTLEEWEELQQKKRFGLQNGRRISLAV
ncbi:MAG: nucleotidyltransferase domain-containing protein [Chloroflexota bacterium]